jgi:hypothetical protein
VALQPILAAAFRLGKNKLLRGLERCLPDRKSEVVQFLQCPESKEVLMRIGESFIGWSRGKERAAFAVCLVLLATSAGAQFVVDGVSFTTVPPAGDYEVAGVVTSIAPVGMAFLDLTKPLKEALKSLYPDLAAQAKTRGSTLVVITHIQAVTGKDSPYLIVFGTAVRPGRGAGAAVAASRASGTLASTEGEQAADPLSGTWVGKILEVGETKPYDITVNIFKDPSSGSYTGGFAVTDPGCEVTLGSASEDSGTYFFKTDKASKFRCAMFTAVSAKPVGADQLEFKIFKGQKVHMEGTLKRQ